MSQTEWKKKTRNKEMTRKLKLSDKDFKEHIKIP